MGVTAAFRLAGVGATLCASLFIGQLGGMSGASPESQRSTSRAGGAATVADADRDLQSGRRRLAADGPGGYLKSVLALLDIPVESQVLVYSETSLQSARIRPENPRALFFNDRVAVGWVNGASTLEVAALEPDEGVVFYTVDQTETAPRFSREGDRCLQCHRTPATNGVTGMLAMSMLPLADNVHDYAQGWPVDHRTPISERWGGWYVTGERVPRVHLGNVPVHHAPQSYVRLPAAPVLPTVPAEFIPRYLSPHSDVVAHLVFNHQVGMTNLLARLQAESRAPTAQGTSREARLAATVKEVVDYLLFIDEAPLPGAVQGASGFAEVFSAVGPRDRRGRSLRELDLQTRLLRYPCSYMIYTPAFDALPGAIKEALYARLWDVLSAKDKDPVYSGLSRLDRRAIVEILLETKGGLPDYFRPSLVE